MPRKLSLLCLVLLLPFGAYAQNIRASMSGTVTDASGAIVPGAKVTIVNADTGVVVFDGSASESGVYTAPSLPPGSYNVTVQAPGFSQSKIEKVGLQVDQRARVDVVLKPGEVAESITVVGEGVGRLEAESSSIGAVIGNRLVIGLPLPNRNVLNTLTLVGGVSSGGAATGINASQLSINGSRTLNSEFSVDGVSVVSGSTGGVQRTPSAEVVLEFKVLTSGYTAEYGRTSGGFINAVLDSGKNEFRGALYEYFRNEKLNANNFFNNLRGVERPSDRYNLFGGKISGPVLIPRLYNGRDRTFFLFHYEGLRRQVPFNNLATVPSAEFRGGDFSASPITVIDPSTGAPFPNNRIPSNRIDPAAARILNLLPQGNQPGTRDAANGRNINNYLNTGSTSVVDDQWTIRGDHAIGTAARIFGRYTSAKNTAPSAVRLPGPLDPRVGDSITTSYQAVTSWTHVWSPTLISEASFGYQRNNPAIDPPSLGINVQETFGIARSPFAASPRFNFGWGDVGIDSNTYRRQIDNNFQSSASLTWIRNNHTFKGGFQLRKNQFNVFNPGGNFTGIYNFTGQLTSSTQVGGNPVNSLADMLLGLVKTANYDLFQPPTGRRNYNLGIFFQDDWKIRRNLTINVGLRWEYEAPMTMSNDVYSRVDITTGQLLVANQNASRSLNLNAPKNNFAPRVGFAWSLNDKTVVRSAFGIFYSQIFSNLGGVVGYPGFTVAQQFPDLGVGIAQPFRLSEGIPLVAVQNFSDPFFVERNASVNNPLAAGAQFGEIDPMPRSLQWNFGIQRQITRTTLVDVSYVGTRGLNLPLSLQFNPIPFERAEELARIGSGVENQRARPFPTVNSLGSFVHAGTSSYHSLQVQARREFANRFGLLGSYTWSKSIDDGSGIFAFSQPNGLDQGQLPHFFRNLDRGLSSLDRPHNLAAAFQYQTAGPVWTRNWIFSPILVLRSGLPDTINQNNLFPGAVQQRPNSKGFNYGGYAPETTSEGQAIRYLLAPTDANFPFSPSGPLYTGSGATRRQVLPATLGTLGRNTTREPYEFNIDLAVSRIFPIRERLRFEIRGEAFNLLNWVNFNAPNTGLTAQVDGSGNAFFNSPGFGLITSAKSARFMQLVARFEF
jgi:hypothetical protein